MTISYMVQPKNRVTVGATNYDNRFDSCVVFRNENAFDTAMLTVRDVQAAFRANLTAGSTISINVKDEGGSYETQLAGVIRFITEGINPELITLTCDQIGFGLSEMKVAEEYGTQSSHATLDTIKEILTDASYGIIPKWVNKILGGATNSQYSFDTTYVETITGTIPYVYFPYKPASKALGDLTNLTSALGHGAHWIVTTSGGTVYLRVKEIGGTQTGWTKYYGNSQAAATLVQGTDFEQFNPKTQTSQANYVLYHSQLWKPLNYVWTENNAADWDGVKLAAGTALTITDDATYYTHGAKSIKCLSEAGTGSGQGMRFWYPDTYNLALDLSQIGGKYNKAAVCFQMYPSGAPPAGANRIDVDGSTYWYPEIMLGTGNPSSGTWYVHQIAPKMTVGTWNFIQLPIGDNTGWRAGPGGAGNWADTDYIQFRIYNADGTPYTYLDGLQFRGWILRGAYNSTLISSQGAKIYPVNDAFPNDDTLIAASDTGTAALVAYAELLRLQTTPTVGTLHCTRMIKDILAGQWVHVHAKKNSGGTYQIDGDFRVTQVKQMWDAQGYRTNLDLTSDVTNSFANSALNSHQEIQRAQRPEFQDRQATGIKMREIDITQPILAVDYA